MWVTQGPATVATVNDNQVFFPNKGPGIFKCGDWHVYEVVMEVNDIGAQNGKITAWIDGVQSHEHTNVAFVTAARPNGFSGRALNPVWGGLGTPKTREDRVYWDHLVISGKL